MKTAPPDRTAFVALMLCGILAALGALFASGVLRIVVAGAEVCFFAAWYILQRGSRAARQASETKYRLLFENLTAGFALHQMIYDDQGNPVDYRYLELNPEFERLTGLAGSNLIGKTIRQMVPGTEQYWIDVFGKVAKTGEPIAYENYSRDFGKYFDTWVFSPQKDQFAVVFTDVTARHKALDALNESREQFNRVFDAAPVMIALSDRDSGLIYLVNAEATRMSGFSIDEMIGKSSVDIGFLAAEDRAQIIEVLGRQGRVDGLDVRFRTKDGQVLDCLFFAEMVTINGKEELLSIFQDIGPRRRAERAVEEALKEKEILLRELYHRTRNNMAVIVSFLRMGAQDLGDPRVLEVFNQAENRVQTMALVHQKLYEAENLSRIDLSNYLASLVELLSDNLTQGRPNLTIGARLAPCPASIDTAMACGLVVNELVTNAFKYAFPDGRPGTIEVSLTHAEGSDPCLSVTDNGVGFPVGFDSRVEGGVGLEVVRSVARLQLRATSDIRTGPNAGVAWSFTFPESVPGAERQSP
jgi:PAS domain S-box-containing protein